MRLIGFGGPAEHGKSSCVTLAEELLVNQGYHVRIISFADRLKAACKIMFRLTDKDLNHSVSKATVKSHLGTTPREVMQKFGTEVCRDTIPRYVMGDILKEEGGIWTWNVERDILEMEHEDPDTIILIPDLRFESELAMLRRHGVTFINVIRPGHHNAIIFKHLSEEGLSGADYTIVNDGSLDDIRTKVKDVIKSLNL
jgi:hypothetical protein